MAPAVTPIATVRNPMAPNHPAPGTLVTITGHVTAVRPDMGTARGFTMQDGTTAFSGITIFTAGTAAGVAVGNEVTVTGTYEEYFGLSELTMPTISVVNNGTTLPYAPIDLAPATLATPATGEAYESMLVRVSTVDILTQNADAPQDFDEFVVTGNLRINDSYYPAIDNLCAVGSSFGSITGVMNYSFNNAKLEPRNATDFANASCQVYP
jgi:predicted extracellular nuclease